MTGKHLAPKFVSIAAYEQGLFGLDADGRCWVWLPQDGSLDISSIFASREAHGTWAPISAEAIAS